MWAFYRSLKVNKSKIYILINEMPIQTKLFSKHCSIKWWKCFTSKQKGGNGPKCSCCNQLKKQHLEIKKSRLSLTVNQYTASKINTNHRFRYFLREILNFRFLKKTLPIEKQTCTYVWNLIHKQVGKVKNTVITMT